MTTNTMWLEIDPERVAHVLRHDAAEKVNGGDSGVALDFSGVARIDPAAALALEELADLAAAKSVTLTLRGVNRDVYKVLKLLHLTRRFSFVE